MSEEFWLTREAGRRGRSFAPPEKRLRSGWRHDFRRQAAPLSSIQWSKWAEAGRRRRSLRRLAQGGLFAPPEKRLRSGWRREFRGQTAPFRALWSKWAEAGREMRSFAPPEKRLRSGWRHKFRRRTALLPSIPWSKWRRPVGEWDPSLRL